MKGPLPNVSRRDSSIEVDEKEWLRSRIGRLRDLLKFVTDDRAIATIESLVAEAEARLEELQGRH